MKPTENQNDSKDIKEFYEQGGRQDPNFCNHAFTRLSPTRIVCRLCGIGFFDNPFNPFPVDEINKQIRKETRENKKLKKELENKDVDKTE